MRKTTLAATLAWAALAACGGKTKDKATMGSGSGSSMGDMNMGSGSSMGSDMVGSGSASAVETKPAPPPPPPPKTTEEDIARYQECFGFFNDGKWDDFKKCWASDGVSEAPGSGMPPNQGPDAIVGFLQTERTAFPDEHGDLQLVLANGNHLVGVVLITGTNNGPMKTPAGDMPATKKKIGFLFAHQIDFNPQGEASHETAFADTPTLLGQLGVSKMPARKAMTKGAASPEIVIAKNDDAEKANVAVFQAAVDAFNKHDAKAFGDTLDKKVVWSDLAEPKDLDMKGAVKDAQSFWKGFSDVKISPDAMWGAGDYVVMTGTIGGTNDGDLPAMKMKKTGKSFSSPFMHIVKVGGGKITKSWIFYDSMGFAMQLGMMPGPGGGKGSK